MTTGWRSIETAPIGKKVIGLWEHCYGTGCTCHSIGWATKVLQDRKTHWEDEHDSRVRAPDYWMPFDPPEAAHE